MRDWDSFQVFPSMPSSTAKILRAQTLLQHGSSSSTYLVLHRHSYLHRMEVEWRTLCLLLFICVFLNLGVTMVESRAHPDQQPSPQQHHRYSPHMFDLTDTFQQSNRNVAGATQNQRSAIEAVLRSRSNSTQNLYTTAWSAWTPCNRKCKQRRHRCPRGDCSHGNRLVEKRSCWRLSGRTGRCQVRRHRTPPTGHDRKSRGDRRQRKEEDDVLSAEEEENARVENIVYDLLYYDWTLWTACTRSCKRRRFRVCALRRWCKNTVLMEEKRCYVPGTKCEEQYLQNENWDADQVPPELSDDQERQHDSTERSKKGDASTSRTGRRRKKPAKPMPSVPPWDPSECGQRNPAMDASLKIVGGQQSRRGAWPWQVAILTRPHQEQYCGGVLISPYHVLTAAHCVRRRNRKRRVIVRVGEYDLGGTEGTEQDIRVAADFVHDNFNMDTIDSDIAVLRLRTPVIQGEYIKYACVPEEEDRLPVNKHCYAIGWGKMKDTHLFGTDILREAKVPLVSNEKCQEAFDYEITANQMCAGYPNGGVDTCAGDSGGPLMCEIEKDGQSRWYVYGVTSFGEGCGDRGKYGIYTRVNNFAKWISSKARFDQN